MPEVMTAAEYLAQCGKRHKYGVAPKADRTWNGRTYASKAERMRAEHLWGWLGILGGEIIEQPRVRLGPDCVYVPDFLVIGPTIRYEDVKGAETREFKRVRRLWAKYGRLPLWVVRLKRGEWDIEVIGGAE